MAVELAGCYSPRPVVPLGIWARDGWRIKRYSIAYGRERARAELVAAAEAVIAGVLPAPAVPCTWWSHRNPGCFQVRACCLSTHTGGLLDAPQGPSELPQCDDLLFLLFAQDIAHVTEAICPLVSVNVPDFIVGRFG